MKFDKINFFSARFYGFFTCCISTLSLISCSTSRNIGPVINYEFTSLNGSPDYSNLDYWAAHPWKPDPSDSISTGLAVSQKNDSAADVFFIYPTSFTDQKNMSWNAPIDDQAINQKTDHSSILYQASVFNERSRIFAPRYRQANIKAFFVPKDESQPYFDSAYQDVKEAFIYYLRHFNQHRPIIIASHSQGTLHAARLLKEFFEGKDLQNQLVCAYILGLPVPENYFTSIPVCKDSLSTGCFVSWRTFKRGYTPKYISKESIKMAVVNPLTWTSDTELAPSNLNKGAVLRNFNKVVAHALNAEVHGNILWASKPNVPGKFLLVKKNYHIGDINLFYVNIRQNVNTRITQYLKIKNR